MKKLKVIFPLVAEFVETLVPEEFYFMSGSYQFGCPSEKSDIDICVPITMKNRITTELENRSIPMEESHYNSGVKVINNGKEVNFIFLHPVEYVCWYRAAQMIVTARLFEKSTDKQLKHAIHQTLVAMVKASQTEYINVNTMLSAMV